jgi:hypothetical protein
MPKINTVTAADALAKFKGMSLGETVKAAAELGNIPNTGGIQSLLCGLAFQAGRAARAKKLATYSFADQYDAFAAAYYSWSGRTAPSKASREQYVSKFNAFAEAGLKPWDATPIVVTAIDMRDQNLSWKAGRVRELVKGDKPPPAAEVKKAFEVTEGNSRPAGRSVEANLKGVLNSIEKLAMDRKFIKGLAEAGSLKLEAMRTIFDGAQALRDVYVSGAGKAVKPKMAKLQDKVIAGIKALPPRPRNARSN